MLKKKLILVEDDLFSAEALIIILASSFQNVEILHFVSPQSFQEDAVGLNPDNAIGFISDRYFYDNNETDGLIFLQSLQKEFLNSFFILWTNDNLENKYNDIKIISKSSAPTKIVEAIKNLI